MKVIKSLSILFVFLAAASLVQAQLSISPPYVSIDGRSGVGNIYVTNNSDQPQEVEISFAFGYPDSDKEGNLVMNYGDSVAFEKYALDPSVRAFPRTFILAGKQQRTIRVQVKPDKGMADGFFFTRAKILAKPQSAEVSKPAAEGITTKISYNFEQIIPAFYRKGKVTTGLNVLGLDTRQVDSVLVVTASLERTGEAPFIGSFTANLIDAGGKTVATTKTTTTAYFKVLRKVELGIARIPKGAYKLEVLFETKRGDMAAGDLVQAQPVKQMTDVTIR